MRVLVRLVPAPDPQTVTWSFRVVDRCTGATDTAPGGSVTVPPGAEQAAAVDTVALPPQTAVAVVAVTEVPAAAAAPPVLVGSCRARAAGPREPRGGGRHADHRAGSGRPWRPSARDRRRTRQQRRNLRSGAFDLLAVVAALALVGLGLANLYLTGAPELAVRQAMIAGGGVLALALFWRVRVRFLGVLGWVAYGAAVLLLVAVLAVGLSANGATRWIGIGPVSFQPSELAKLGLLLVLAAVLGSSRPAWQRFSLAVLLAVVPIGLTAGAAGPQHHDAARRPRRIHAGHRARARCGSCCRWSPRRPSRRRS